MVHKNLDMFKKSDDHRQLDAVSSPTEYFNDSTKNYYLKNDSWHNQFRKQVVMRVDETVFSVLYTRRKGAPNISLRLLVGMMILEDSALHLRPTTCSGVTWWNMPENTERICSSPVRYRSPRTSCSSSSSKASRCAWTASSLEATLPGTHVTSWSTKPFTCSSGREKSTFSSEALLKMSLHRRKLGSKTTSRRPSFSWATFTQTIKVGTGNFQCSNYGLTPDRFG